MASATCGEDVSMDPRAVREISPEDIGNNQPVKSQSRAIKSNAAKRLSNKTAIRRKKSHLAKVGKPKRSFPNMTLEESLKVPQVIRQNNNGHPWDTGLVAGLRHNAEGRKVFLSRRRSP